MAATKTGKIVFTGSWEWWQIVSRGEIETDDGTWDEHAEHAASVADLDTDDEEAWVAIVTEVADRHTAIRPGDYACCQGIGSSVAFVRLS